MKRLFVLLTLLPGLSLAQDIANYNRALSAFNAGDYDAAATGFFEITETSTDAELKAKSEYYLAQSLAKSDLPVSAMIRYAGIVQAGKAHPFHLKSVEGLVAIQRQLGEREWIPRVLDRFYAEEWATLPLEVLARVNYLIGLSSHKSQKFEEAKGFFEAVPPQTSIYAKAQYMLGITLAHWNYPGGPKAEEAIRHFDNVLALKDQTQQDLVYTQQLAQLGLGRTYYNMGQYAKSADAYERIPRFSRFWDQALFENGFARFQNEDFGGALGSLQALHAPQFAGAFQPESWILKSTVYYFSCLYEEAKAALVEFESLYQPMQEKLKAILEKEDQELERYYKLVEAGDEAIPKAVLNWVRSSEGLRGVMATLDQLDKEKQAITANQAWRSSKLPPDLISSLDQNRDFWIKTAGKEVKFRLRGAHDDLRTYTDNAEIIRFETSKAEKEMAEAGFDQAKYLANQNLYRPKMPGEDWNYWKFQGEFWRDEIGYYQYTLKKGREECGSIR